MSIDIDWNVLRSWAPTIQGIIQGAKLDEFEDFAAVAAECASHCLMVYTGYLQGQPLPNGSAIQHPSGELAKHATMASKGYLDWYLENDSPYAEAIEKGTKQRDMKEMLPRAKKARMSKSGSLYLIIPFRHGTPGTVGMKAMPARVHLMAKSLTQSRVTGSFREISGTGHDVSRNTYRWGTKLGVKDLQAAGLGFQAQARFQGMYKFGETGHHSYVTFRVMSARSAGWIIPARPGLYPARTAVEEMLKATQEMRDQAVMSDLMRIGGFRF